MRRALFAAVLLIATTALAGSAGGEVAVNTTLRVTPTGSDGNPCTSSKPCKSFGRAYDVAKAGQTISVAAGTYGPQVVPFIHSKAGFATNVRFLAQPGVIIKGDLYVYGSHVTVVGSPRGWLRLHTLWSRVTGANATSHQLFENLHGATFQVWGTRNVMIRRADWGPAKEPMDMESRIGPDGGVLNSYPEHITLDHVTIHDQNSVNLQENHNGGLELIAGRWIVIENSTFARNSVYDIEVQDFTTPACCGMKYGNASNVTLRGNVFGASVLGPPYGTPKQTAGQPEVQFDPQGGGWSGWTISRNLFEEGLATAFDGEGSFYRSFRVGRNLAGRLSDCGGAGKGAVWRGNLVAGRRCGGDPLPFGYRLHHMRLVRGRGADAIAYVFRTVGAHWSLRRVAAVARTRRLPPPAGGWTALAVRSIATNSVYLGGRYGPRGAHRALVGIRTWRKAQRALVG